MRTSSRWALRYDSAAVSFRSHSYSTNGRIVQAQYQDLVEWFSTINRAQSPSNSFIQAVLQTENPKVNEEVTIEVNSTAPLDTYVYEVMGRGNLVVARTVQAGNQRYTHKSINSKSCVIGFINLFIALSVCRSSHTFRFQATPAMAPVARVVVYYVRPDGEVVADALNFDVEGTFQNFVSVSCFIEAFLVDSAINWILCSKRWKFVLLPIRWNREKPSTSPSKLNLIRTSAYWASIRVSCCSRRAMISLR